MSQPWDDSRIGDAIARAGMGNLNKAQVKALMYKLRNEIVTAKDAEMALLRQEIAGNNEQFDEGALIMDAAATMIDEYKALWDAAIAFMNSPGNLESMAVDSYSALVRQVIRSRFWNEAIETTSA